MLLTEYVKKASKLTVIKASNGEYYLEPLWFVILKENGLNVEDVKDAEITKNDVFEILKLDVAKRNTIHSKQKMVIDWLYDLITAQVEPTILQEETEFIKKFYEDGFKSNTEA